MKLLALKMPSAILAPPTEPPTASSSSSLSLPARWYDDWCHSKVHDLELYFRGESQRLLRINEHQNSSSGIGSHLNRLKRNQNKHLLNRLKIHTSRREGTHSTQEEGDEAEDEEGGDIDDDVTISTIGMESVQSSPSLSPVKPFKRHKEEDKNQSLHVSTLRKLNRQSSSSSTLTSSSTLLLSPIKSSSSISSLGSRSQPLVPPPVVDIRGKMSSIHYNLASPHIFSHDALKERNQLLKEREEELLKKGVALKTREEKLSPLEDESMTSSSSSPKKKAVGLSFALSATLVSRAHQVKTKISEENEEMFLEEMARKERQQDSSRSDRPSVLSLDFTSSLSHSSLLPIQSNVSDGVTNTDGLL
jgi:hypothetical protein